MINTEKRKSCNTYH